MPSPNEEFASKAWCEPAMSKVYSKSSGITDVCTRLKHPSRCPYPFSHKVHATQMLACNSVVES